MFYLTKNDFVEGKVGSTVSFVLWKCLEAKFRKYFDCNLTKAVLDE